MKEVIIVGGSYNPPTPGHAEIWRNCLDLPEIDEVWVMPSGQRADKVFATTNEQRLEMLELIKAEVFTDEPRLVVTDFEMQLPTPTETYKTLGALALTFPDIHFSFVFGVDAYKNLARWNHGTRLQRELSLYIVPRDGELPPEAPNIRVLPPVGDVSSTLAREAAGRRQSVLPFVHRVIADYIGTQNLYVQPVQ